MIDPAKYSTRLIALKFAYLGQRYNGFEHHTGNQTPLPTVEEELWKALKKARLVFPTNLAAGEGQVSWEGCEYSKCGRTDKGVSAFGQVIALRVRSNRPLVTDKMNESSSGDTIAPGEGSGTLSPSRDAGSSDLTSSSLLDDPSTNNPLAFHPINDEISYTRVLNRLLPPDIRVYAWCPAPSPSFSARFSCKERRYRYFFTQPAFNPTFGNDGELLSTTTSRDSRGSCRREGWLDIEAMQNGAKRFEGLHDFRNFCKVDASKQIDNFERRIFYSEIRPLSAETEPAAYISGMDFAEFIPLNAAYDLLHEVPCQDSRPRIYEFVLHGSGFLWHQVRHMAAILFLIGQGLESPDVIDKLLDIHANPQKPTYEMAEDAPLVLWDCIFPSDRSGSREDSLDWIYVGDRPNSTTSPVRSNGQFGLGGVVDDVWGLWRQKKIDEILAGTLLNVMAKLGKHDATKINDYGVDIKSSSTSQKVFYGGNYWRPRGKYVPVLERPRLESVETINLRFAARKGLDRQGDGGETLFQHDTHVHRNLKDV